MNIKEIKAAHFVGIGGINMSAVAKLLLASGIKVSGSDMAENEQTRTLDERGAMIVIGHTAANVPTDVEVVIHTSAAPESNPERVEAERRGIPEITNFRFLGDWFKDSKIIVVTGTHGKSTTTAMLGLALEKANFDPTVIVGSKVPGFEEGNLRIGGSAYRVPRTAYTEIADEPLSTKYAVRGTDVFVVEGDEYARHFLEFEPYGVIINNIELDHTDIYPTLDDYVGAFREMLSKIKDGGVVVVNVGDANVAELITQEAEKLAAKHVRIIPFVYDLGLIRTNVRIAEQAWRVSSESKDGLTEMALAKPGLVYRFDLAVPGSHNVINAAGAAFMALQLGAPYHFVAEALEGFKGIWRRFELLGEIDGAKIYSDYGHHPTAVSSTLAAAREVFPQSRIVLCFQPHHRNRTKNLFADFIPAFDGADVLVLCEIYDVKGRDEAEDAEVSSKQLVAAVMLRDVERKRQRVVEFAPDPAVAVERTRALLKPGDTVIMMGAGDIDEEARKMFS